MLKQKHVLCIISAILLFFALTPVRGFASTTMHLTCQDVHVKEGQSFYVTLKTEGNPGLMGFKFTAAYDDTVLNAPQVRAAGITKNGSLDSSIGVAEGTAFDVLWTNTFGVSGDDVLLELGFTVAEHAADTVIKIIFSAPDTFTESWETVEVEPLEIKVLIESAPENENKQTSGSTSVSENVTQTPATGSETENSTGQPAFPYLSKTERDFAEDIFRNNEPEAIQKAIDSALRQVESDTVENVSSDKRAEFVQAFENELKQASVPFSSITDQLSVDDALSVIIAVKDAVAAPDTDTTAPEGSVNGESAEPSSEKTERFPKWAIAVLSAGCVLLAAFAVWIFVKKKK